MEVIYSRACGVDVHKTFIVAVICITEGEKPKYIRKRFSTYNNDLIKFREWLITNDCLNVCMESTGKYYIPSGRCIQAIDYTHRDEDGSVGTIPDSLTQEFYTRSGRPVRDGGGVTPEIDLTEFNDINIAHHLYMQHYFFDFATLYAQQHPVIVPVDSPSSGSENSFIPFSSA